MGEYSSLDCPSPHASLKETSNTPQSMNFKHKINQIRSRLNMGLVKEHRMNPANEAWLKGLQDVQEKCLPAPCEGCRLPLAQKRLIFMCYYSMGYYPRRLNATG